MNLNLKQTVTCSGPCWMWQENALSVKYKISGGSSWLHFWRWCMISAVFSFTWIQQFTWHFFQVFHLFLLRSMDNHYSGSQNTQQTANLAMKIQSLSKEVWRQNGTKKKTVRAPQLVMKSVPLNCEVEPPNLKNCTTHWWKLCYLLKMLALFWDTHPGPGLKSAIYWTSLSLPVH